MAAVEKVGRNVYATEVGRNAYTTKVGWNVYATEVGRNVYGTAGKVGRNAGETREVGMCVDVLLSPRTWRRELELKEFLAGVSGSDQVRVLLGFNARREPALQGIAREAKERLVAAGLEVRIAALEPALAGQCFAIRNAKILIMRNRSWIRDKSDIGTIWGKWWQLWCESASEPDAPSDHSVLLSAFDDHLQSSSSLTMSRVREPATLPHRSGANGYRPELPQKPCESIARGGYVPSGSSAKTVVRSATSSSGDGDVGDATQPVRAVVELSDNR